MIYLPSVFLSIGTTVATLTFSEKVHEVIQLLKAFEVGFETKSDAKTISCIGTFSLPEVLF